MKKRIISLITAMALVLAMMPAMVFAEGEGADDPLAVSFNDCAKIGYNSDREADIYYLEPDPVPAEIALTDLQGNMEDGMIASFGNSYVEGTNIVPLSAGYELKYEQLVDSDHVKGYLTEPLAKSYNYFGYWITDDDYDEYYLIVRGNPYEEKTYNFTASAGGSELTEITKEEKGYTYTNWKNVSTSVDLYTVVIPRDTKTVDFVVDNPVLAYNYAKNNSTDDDYLAGAVKDIYKPPVSFTASVDSKKYNYDGSEEEADGVFDFIQVQTPYDAFWNSELLFAVTFKYSDETVAQIASEKIDALLNKGDERSVDKAKALFDELTDPQKALVDADVAESLQLAAEIYELQTVDAKNAAVRDALQLVKSVKPAKYTKSSYAVFDKAADELKALVKDDNAKAADVKKALLDLNKAFLELKEKSANTLKVTAKKIIVKKKALKKKSVTVKKDKVMTVSKAVGKVAFKKVSGSNKLTVNSDGSIVVKKQTKKGLYKVKVNVAAAGNDNIAAGNKTVTLKVKVK